MGIDNIRHPIKDTVKADNSTYSSNKIESLIHSATELPETSIEDAGDVLMVNDEGEWAKGEIIIPQEVPTPTVANIGKVVSVVSDGDEGAEYGLEDVPNEVPTPAVADSGKVISVNTSGEYVLKTPYIQKTPAGTMMNGATVNRLDLGAEASSFNPNECVLNLVDPTVGAIYFRNAGLTPAPDLKVIFSALSYESSKLYYYEIRVQKTVTSIPAGTTVTKIEIA